MTCATWKALSNDSHRHLHNQLIGEDGPARTASLVHRPLNIARRNPGNLKLGQSGSHEMPFGGTGRLVDGQDREESRGALVNPGPLSGPWTCGLRTHPSC